MQKDQNLMKPMVNLQEEKTLKMVKDRINAGQPAKRILSDLQESLIEIGNRFEKDEYFVPELIYGSEIMKRSLEFLKPHFQGEPIEKKHKVIMGTVYGDVHDIGKDIVVGLLDGTGFEVIDLGVNVEPDAFVNAIKETGSKLVGMSVMLTMAFGALSDTIKAISDAGYRKVVSIMIGGAPITEYVRKRVGADFYGKDAYQGVKIAQRVYGQD
jgi:5-methyltetrahydrofolate--homocysteine methyltransferase